MSLRRKVLLLNASYEALGVVEAPRAVRLVWKGAAQPVEYVGGGVLRSQHFVFVVPSVIRLVEYIDVRRRRAQSGKQRIRILARDKLRCQYCGAKGTLFDLTSTTSCRARAAGARSPRTCARPASRATSARATARPTRRACRSSPRPARSATGSTVRCSGTTPRSARSGGPTSSSRKRTKAWLETRAAPH